MSEANQESLAWSIDSLRIKGDDDLSPISYDINRNSGSGKEYPFMNDLLEKIKTKCGCNSHSKTNNQYIFYSNGEEKLAVSIRYRSSGERAFSPIDNIEKPIHICILIAGDPNGNSSTEILVDKYSDLNNNYQKDPGGIKDKQNDTISNGSFSLSQRISFNIHFDKKDNKKPEDINNEIAELVKELVKKLVNSKKIAESKNE